MNGEDRRSVTAGSHGGESSAKQEASAPPAYSSADVERAVAAVPRSAREILLACRADGLSYDEIAVQFGISKRRVIRLMTKALTAMRHAIEMIAQER